MSDYAKLGHKTQPRMPRVEVSEDLRTEADRAADREAVTSVRCPGCAGNGYVPPDVAVAIDLALALKMDES